MWIPSPMLSSLSHCPSFTLKHHAYTNRFISTTFGLVEVPELVSTTFGINTSLISTTFGDDNQLISTSFGFTNRLISTTFGLVEVAELLSTNFGDDRQLISTVAGLGQIYLSTATGGSAAVPFVSALTVSTGTITAGSTIIQNNRLTSRNLLFTDVTLPELSFYGGTPTTGVDTGGAPFYGPRIAATLKGQSFQDDLRLSFFTGQGTNNNRPIERMTIRTGVTYGAGDGGAGGVGINCFPSTLLDVNGTGRFVILSTLQASVSSIGANCNAPFYPLDVNGPAQVSSLYFSTTVGGRRMFIQQTPFQTGGTNCIGILAENYDSLGPLDTDWLKVRGLRIGQFGISSFAKFERWGSNGFVLGSQSAGNATTADYIFASNGIMTMTNVQNLSSLQIFMSSITGQAITTSSLQVNSLTIGTGTGWVNIGPIQTVAISSIQANANTSFAITMSSFQGNFSSVLSLNASLSSVQTSTISFGPTPGWVRTNLMQGIVFSSIQTNTAFGYVSSLLVGTPSTNAFQVPQFNLQLINNSAAKPVANTWSVGSDSRIKENITDANIDRCYEDIRSIHLRRFMWTQEYFNEIQGFDRHVLGFIAQEVSTIVPKAVEVKPAYGYSNFQFLNIDQLNMSLYGAVKRVIQDKEILESTVKGQKFTIETLLGTQTMILSTLNGLQGR